MTPAPAPSLFARLGDRIDGESLRPDLGRATRATFALLLPLILAAFGKLPFEVSFFVLPAHGVACWDVRGPYGLRLAVLGLMVLVITAAAAGGAVAHDHLWSALIATAVLGVAVGALRHLTADYGPSLAGTTGLVFFMALLGRHPGAHWPSAMAGATWSLLLQVARWPIRPQQPIRRAVAESWLAAAALFDSLATPGVAGDSESAARGTLDRTYTLFTTARRTGPFRQTLEALHTACAQLITRAVALSTAVESLAPAHAKPLLSPLAVTLESLAFNARQIALATVSNQPGHVAVVDVRLQRATGLLHALDAAVDALPPAVLESQPLTFLIQSIEAKLKAANQSLHALRGHADARADFPLELFDLATWRWRALAPVLNLRPGVERALLRFTLRLSVMLLIGVTIVWLHPFTGPLPHAYWLPFTMVVVSQIDFGATRKRALERLGGTLVGSLIGSGVLFLKLPLPLIFAGIGATGFGFAYYLRNRYRIAVIYVTVMVVLLTESSQTVTPQLTAERFGLTLLGGTLAMVSAFAFWPSWERHRTRELIVAALRAAADYATVVRARLANGGAYTPGDVKHKRAAEAAAGEALASLGRMYADPKTQRAGVEQAAVLANGVRRVTRMLNVLLIHETPGALPAAPESLHLLDCAAQYMKSQAAALEANTPCHAECPAAATEKPEDWVAVQLTRMQAELNAMRFSLAELVKNETA